MTDSKGESKLLSEFKAEELSNFDIARGFPLYVKNACSMTIQLMDYQYRKVPLLSGQEMHFVGCYEGKRQGVICRFKPPVEDSLGNIDHNSAGFLWETGKGPKEVLHFEVPLSQLAETFDGGEELVGLLISPSKTEQETEDRYQDDQRYGAWS